MNNLLYAQRVLGVCWGLAVFALWSSPAFASDWARFHGPEGSGISVGTGSGSRGWGTASSPILYKDLVIVTASAESEALVALNKETGREVWRRKDAGFSSTWGTPTARLRPAATRVFAQQSSAGAGAVRTSGAVWLVVPGVREGLMDPFRLTAQGLQAVCQLGGLGGVGKRSVNATLGAGGILKACPTTEP